MLTIDMDGVICDPILSRNLGIHRSFLDPSAPPPRAHVPPRWLGGPLDALRFDLRRPLPDARDALARLRAVRRLVLLTGRRSRPRRWLRRHGFLDLLDEVVINEGPYASPHFKLDALERVGAAEHIDDDPRTVQLLTQCSSARVYLRVWPESRHVVLDDRVERVANLAVLADRLGAPVLDGSSR